MPAAATRTQWGGLADRRERPGGFFRTTQIDGVWWLIDPDGGRFLSKGVDSVRFDQDCIRDTSRAPYAEAAQAKYGGPPQWRRAIAARLLSWGVNSLGAWSDQAVARAASSPLAIAPNLDLGNAFAARSRTEGAPPEAFPDVFDLQFDPFIRQRAEELCGPWRNDPGVIGWFTDNELRWGPDWRGEDELLTLFLNMPPASAGRRAAIALLRSRHGAFSAFNAVWQTTAASWDELGELATVAAPYRRAPTYDRDAAAERRSNAADSRRAAFMSACDAFAGQVAGHYFARTSAAIRAADPNHLILGCRFAYVPDAAVIATAGDAVDVVSFNCYGLSPVPPIQAYAATGKPCLIGEFSFRGDDSGLPNTIGAGERVPTQADRARCFSDFVIAALHQPTVVGYHWFEHADQPAGGRFDGENSNFGTVTIDDVPYAALTQAMAAVNAEAEPLHAAAAQLAA